MMTLMMMLMMRMGLMTVATDQEKRANCEAMSMGGSGHKQHKGLTKTCMTTLVKTRLTMERMLSVRRITMVMPGMTLTLGASKKADGSHEHCTTAGPLMTVTTERKMIQMTTIIVMIGDSDENGSGVG